jgi:hypothetical protein
MVQMDPRLYPSYLRRDPLLENTELSNKRKLAIDPPLVIDRNVEKDNLLRAYIIDLDEEVFSKPPDGMSEAALVFWEVDRWSDLCTKIADTARIHGWCVPQFYEPTEDHQRWRVFSVPEFGDWIREPAKDADENIYIKLGGMEFTWADFLGNSSIEPVLLDDDTNVLVKYREGDGKQIFAFPDLTDAIMTSAFNYRQIRGQMSFSGSRPGFKHFVYGDSADDPKADKLGEKLRFADQTTGVGAPEDVLREIRGIQDESIAISIPALHEELKIFAGATRLPLSYYSGEREKGGLGDTGEVADILKIRHKKEFIFNKFIPYIKELFFQMYDIELGDVTLPIESSLEDIMKNNEKNNPLPNKKSDKND